MTLHEDDIPVRSTTFRKLIIADRLHRSEIERRVSRLGIHNSQHRMLMYLAQMDHTPSQRELADLLGISPAAVTTMLKALEREGYVSRCMTDEDNRRNNVFITEAGRRKIEESCLIFDSVDEATFDGFSEAELVFFSELLDRMINNLNALAPAHDGSCRADE